MAIVKLPPGYKLSKPFVCVLCSVSLSLDKATAGLYDADGKQAFACVSHFSEPDMLIRSWAYFVHQEALRYLQKGDEPDALIYGG